MGMLSDRQNRVLRPGIGTGSGENSDSVGSYRLDQRKCTVNAPYHVVSCEEHDLEEDSRISRVSSSESESWESRRLL